MEFILGAIGIVALCIVLVAMGLMESYKSYDDIDGWKK